MAKGKVRNLEDGFTPDELNIVSEFLNGTSIRKLAETSTFGRTAIKNLLVAYKTVYPDKADEIDAKLFGNKNHKEKPETEIREISEEELIEIYNKIMNGQMTLTQSSLETGRNREYIKNRIYEYLQGDEQKIQEFNDQLRQNQLPLFELERLKSFMALGEEQKREFIFDAINAHRKKTGKPCYNDKALEKKFYRLRDYFLVKRNSKFEEPVLTEEEFWKMLYDTPGLINYSLSDKIDPAMRNLDKNENIGPINATRIVVEDAAILACSIPRTNLQIRMLVDYDMLDLFLKKPRYFRTSPELLYGLIKYAEEHGKSKSQTLLTDAQLVDKYGIDSKEIKGRYNPQDEYEDLEYFDK